MARNLFVLVAIFVVLFDSSAICALVETDLLAGIGDFEYCADTAWNVCAHPGYDFDAQSGWVGDYRSSITIKQIPSLRKNESGNGDLVTIECLSSDSRSNVVSYEFTDGSGARPGNVRVTVLGGATPETVASSLAEAINANQGSQGSNVVLVTSSGNKVLVKPRPGWVIKKFADSDTSDVRLACNHITWLYGFDLPSPDNSVAVGWVKKAGETVHPRNNAIFRIAVGEGIGASNCQYFALKDYSGSRGTVYLSTSVQVDNRASSLHPGDRIRFRIDHLRPSGFVGLGSNCQAEARIGIILADQRVEKVIPVNQGRVSAEVVGGPIPQGVKYVSAYVRIDVSGDASGKELGMYVDGAHLFVTRAGQTEPQRWEVPVSRNRSCRTLTMCRSKEEFDPYEAASNYDAIVLNESESRYIPLLRYLNPTIKIYLYESVTSTDFRDSRGIEPWYTNCPIPLGHIMASGKTEWLYDDGRGFYVYEQYYPNSYYTRLTKPEFQRLWAQRTADKVRRWRYDGIWIDALAPLRELRAGSRLQCPAREPWEVQNFLRAVLPSIKEAGAEVLHNTCGYNLETEPGSIYTNPFWKPVSPYNTANYQPNTPATVADGIFQEWAFFYCDMANGRINKYDKDYWKRCLDDMDAVKRWNATLAPADRKYYHVFVIGTDSSSDPAYGTDGWLQFGFCSYLLGQNEWTTFGCGLRPSFYANIDFSITKRLGVPVSEHAAYNGDPYLRYRIYGPTSDGGVGGVVVVNANPESRTYLLDFDAIDESGNPIRRNTNVVLKPHTGRIFLNRQSAVTTTMTVPKTVRPGETVTVDVGYVNNTGTTVRNLALRVVVPAEMTYITGSAEESGGAYDPASNVVSWVISTVAPGESGARSFKARVK
jgi:hypothetical protein